MAYRMIKVKTEDGNLLLAYYNVRGECVGTELISNK